MWEVIPEIFIALTIAGFVVVVIGVVLHYGGWDWRIAKIGVAILGVGLFGVFADPVSTWEAMYSESFFFVTIEGISIMGVPPEILFFLLGVVGILMVCYGLITVKERRDWRIAKIGGAVAGVSFALSIFVTGDWLSIRESLPEILFLLGIAGILMVCYGLITVKERGDWRIVGIGGAVAVVSFALAIVPASPFGTSSQQAAANETDMDRCQWKWGATVISGPTSDILSDRGIIKDVSVKDYGDAFRLEVGIAETVGGVSRLATYSADLDRSSCSRVTEFEIISWQILPNGG